MSLKRSGRNLARSHSETRREEKLLPSPSFTLLDHSTLPQSHSLPTMHNPERVLNKECIKTSWVLLGGASGHRGTADMLLSCANTTSWPVTVWHFLNLYTNCSCLHPSNTQMDKDQPSPCVLLFFGKKRAIPSTQRVSNNAMGYTSHLTPPGLQRALLQRGWSNVRCVCPNILADWVHRNTRSPGQNTQ